MVKVTTVGPGKMNTFNVQTTAILTSISLLTWTTALHPQVAQAGPIPAAVTSQQPLIQFRSTSRQRAARPTYFFTVRNPGQAPPMKAVRIVQNRNLGTVRFKENSVKAFAGKRPQQNRALALAPIGGVSEPGAITVAFQKPVLPGETITIVVKPQKNPKASGRYQFGITAFTQPTDITGRLLGYGYLNISAGT